MAFRLPPSVTDGQRPGLKAPPDAREEAAATPSSVSSTKLAPRSPVAWGGRSFAVSLPCVQVPMPSMKGLDLSTGLVRGSKRPPAAAAAAAAAAAMVAAAPLAPPCHLSQSCCFLGGLAAAAECVRCPSFACKYSTAPSRGSWHVTSSMGSPPR